MLKRRHFLLGGAAALAGGYINQRGLRYPRLSFEPEAPASNVSRHKFNLALEGAIESVTNPTSPTQTPDSEIHLRAITPEPRVNIVTLGATRGRIRLSNLAEGAIIKIMGAGVNLREEVSGITRIIEFESNQDQELELAWFLPEQEGADFAVIGDTGAGLELEWCLHRAKQLGAKFLLHLGDFNYASGEYERAIEIFNTAPMPCYVTIGNHDFNDSGLIYEKFIRQIGPLNHHFSFAGTQFLNIDTALDFFPAHSGLRGELLDRVQTEKRRYFDNVCFTHRNFVDPRPGQEHIIGRASERRWLADKLNSIGVENILTGHVHHSAEMEYRELKQFTVGEGLGFEDIVHEQQTSKLLMGKVEMGEKVVYNWQPLNMPWRLHTSPEHEEKLIKEHGPEKLIWYKEKVFSV